MAEPAGASPLRPVRLGAFDAVLEREPSGVIHIRTAQVLAPYHSKLSEPLEHWAKVLDEHDVFWAPVRTPAEVLTDVQARETGAWVRVEDAGVDSVDAPIRYDRTPRSAVPGPPCSGQHTREVLAELGYGDGAIERLTGGQPAGP